MLKGLLAGGITMGVAAVFPEALVFPFFTAVLGLAAGIGPGLALADPMGNSTVQWVAAVSILGLGLVGLWISPLFLAAAWILHGIWAALFPMTVSEDVMPQGFPGFSCSFSLISACFVAYMWAALSS